MNLHCLIGVEVEVGGGGGIGIVDNSMKQDFLFLSWNMENFNTLNIRNLGTRRDQEDLKSQAQKWVKLSSTNQLKKPKITKANFTRD